MDKDLLRIIIIAVGSAVVLGMILWNAYKNRHKNRGINFYDDGDPLENIDESLIVSHEHDDFDIVPIGSAREDDAGLEQPQEEQPEAQSEPVYPTRDELPKLIQFSIVARSDQGFNGAELKAAFDRTGLTYGESVQVFERLDENNLVDFTVASMVDPGTFPAFNLEQFYCPGIVFFMQPRVLDNPAKVFDNFIQTMRFLAADLDGIILDHQHQPLSERTVKAFRQKLSA
jgi:cell division protein ZipA